MARKATGEVSRLADGTPVARVRYAKERLRLRMATTTTDEAAQVRATQLATLAHSLSNADVPIEDAKKYLEMAARARDGRQWEAVVAAVRAECSGEVDDGRPVSTFAAFAKEWTSGDLARRFPDHVRVKDPKRDEDILRLHVNPIIGELALADIGLSDCEEVMAKLPLTLAPASRRHVAQVLRKVLSLAVYPGRFRDGTPITKEWMPKVPKSARKAKSYLYPSEDCALLRCTAIPFERRLFYGILAREGMRADELGSLRWRDVDLERGVIRLDENKTDDPRAWALRSDVVRSLIAWRDHTGADDDECVLSARGVNLVAASALARTFRADLKRAGVTRAELFEKSKARQPIRVHDLRGTFVTISLANGKTETWVADRTGHKSSTMINTYRRLARTAAELGLGELSSMNELFVNEFNAPRIAPNFVPRARIELATRGFSVPDVGSLITIHRETKRISDRKNAEIDDVGQWRGNELLRCKARLWYFRSAG